uniref:Uncharacterized protein n=1 Tax=Oryza rufipogon TaxID=4529 RepID=A0A0E0ND78_ORYRU
MSSPFEVYEEDIILVMKEEKVSRDEALRLLLEEWMDAKRKLEEKLNRVLEKFEEMEAHNGAEDATVIIKAATTDLREASSPTPKTSLSPVCFNENSMHAATSSSHNIELTALTVAKCLKGCSNHGVGAGSLMPTRCPTNCSSPGVIPDHTMATVVACATTSMAFMELVVGEEATCDTYTGTTNCPEVTHTKCSTLGLDVKGDTDQVMVAFLAQPCVFLLNMDNTDVAPHDSVSPFIIDIIPYALDDREEMLRRSIELRPCTHPQYLGKGKYWAGTAMSYGGNHLLAVKRSSAWCATPPSRTVVLVLVHADAFPVPSRAAVPPSPFPVTVATAGNLRANPVSYAVELDKSPPSNPIGVIIRIDLYRPSANPV